VRKETLEQRGKLRNMPVPLRVTVTRETLLLVEGLAKQHEITVEQAVAQAISDWRVRWEASANRRTRLGVEKALRAARDTREVDHIIADFKRQMHATGGAHNPDADKSSCVKGLTRGEGSANVADMAGRSPMDRVMWEANVSNLQLANEINAHYSAVSRWRAGKILPKPERRAAIAKALYVTEYELWPAVSEVAA
jgi:hypothetical protein